ncbi:MAG: S9 family peptidase, partial [Candidatus Eremiobacteraeota bacterium]|nr:S9 family peptidase [Candidatus Eremiobacteraeota bacterium]
MKHTTRTLVTSAIAAVTLLTCGLIANAALPPLIPRAVLFGNPVKASPEISPNGHFLAYLAPDRNNVLGIWVRTVGKTDDHLVASDPKRPIRNITWQPDSKHILFLQDKAGDENFQLLQADVTTARSRDLTPFAGARTIIDDVDPAFPNTMLVDLNRRDKRVFDVYRLNLRTGSMTMDTQNPGNVAGWLADNAMRVRAAVRTNDDGSSEILVRDTVSSPWRTLLKASADENISPQAFSPDNSALYVTSDIGANAARLLRYDLRTGASTVVYSDPTYDVAGVAT